MPVQQRNHYNEEFKRHAVMSFTEGKLTLSDSASKLGITSGMLSKWVKQYPAENPAASNGMNCETEIRQLQIEMDTLRGEMTILKGLLSKCFFEKFAGNME